MTLPLAYLREGQSPKSKVKDLELFAFGTVWASGERLYESTSRVDED